MRIAFLLAFAAIPLATNAPSSDPPSSLRPVRVPGTLRLTHVHEQAVSCRESAGAEALECEAELEPGRAGTSLTLEPVDAEGDPDPSDPRRPVPVAFENLLGRVELSREIEAGAWKLGWPGLEGTHRFGIGEGEALRISLATATGRCVPKRTRCALESAKVTKSAKIPESHRMR